jgi:hypothetical protein
MKNCVFIAVHHIERFPIHQATVRGIFLSQGRLEREGAGAARFGSNGHHFQMTWHILLQASPPGFIYSNTETL